MFLLCIENNDNDSTSDDEIAVVTVVITTIYNIYKIPVCARCYLDTFIYFYYKETESQVKEIL